MAKFTVRVELHEASGEDYQILHEKMKEHGFLQEITNTSTKVVYELPSAEYNRVTGDNKTKNMILRDVMGAVREMISETSNRRLSVTEMDRMYMVLVTKSAGRCWHNLPIAKR